MTPPHTTQLAGRSDWTLMTAVHDALRRDLDQLLQTTTGHASARARWGTFRSQLHFHLAATCPETNDTCTPEGAVPSGANLCMRSPIQSK
jgi:hypothetical protein